MQDSSQEKLKDNMEAALYGRKDIKPAHLPGPLHMMDRNMIGDEKSFPENAHSETSLEKDINHEIFDLTLPDHIEADQNDLEAYKNLAGELGLEGEKAQRIVDFALTIHERTHQSALQEVEQQSLAWSNAAQNDPEYGRGQMPQSIIHAQQALHAFGNDALKELLEETSLGNHPEVIRFFVNVGRQISEDRLIAAQSNAPSTRKTLADILYDN